MTTALDISTFVYQTGTLTIAPGDTTAVFSGTSLASSVKDGDYLFAGGSLAVIQTVTDDTHAALFTPWAGSSVSAGSYLILKASLLRYNAVEIGYDSTRFLAMLDGLKLLYGVVDAAPDDSNGEEDQIAIKIDVTPWKAWLKTGGVWVEQAGSPGGPGATILVQNAEPDTSHPNNSLWIDSDSADLDVYALTGSPLAWADTGMNLKGATGPASLKPIEAWVTATAYVTGPPASFVSQSGSSYQCLIPHTSGTFATDLAAGKWGIVAAKGADGTGAGDVVGPVSAVDSNLALFDTTSGKAIKDSGKSVADFATAAQGAKADSAVQDVAAVTHAAAGKTTPVDADEFAIVDSAASNVLKKLTWANVKAALKTYFDSLATTLTNKTIDTVSNTFKLNGAAFGTATEATAALNAMVGDSGSGGTKGLVAAPAAGDAAAGKFWKANGSWAIPSGGGASAWVNFNGTGTVAIRASLNVSSITDNGTGQYTVNFTSALADANYAAVIATGGTSSAFLVRTLEDTIARTASSFAIACSSVNSGFPFNDVAQVSAAAFR